nr:MAG TPA: hypothetical protein [Caudoviricetes sp.]
MCRNHKKTACKQAVYECDAVPGRIRTTVTAHQPRESAFLLSARP